MLARELVLLEGAYICFGHASDKNVKHTVFVLKKNIFVIGRCTDQRNRNFKVKRKFTRMFAKYICIIHYFRIFLTNLSHFCRETAIGTQVTKSPTIIRCVQKMYDKESLPNQLREYPRNFFVKCRKKPQFYRSPTDNKFSPCTTKLYSRVGNKLQRRRYIRALQGRNRTF